MAASECVVEVQRHVEPVSCLQLWLLGGAAVCSSSCVGAYSGEVTACNNQFALQLVRVGSRLRGLDPKQRQRESTDWSLGFKDNRQSGGCSSEGQSAL